MDSDQIGQSFQTMGMSVVTYLGIYLIIPVFAVWILAFFIRPIRPFTKPLTFVVGIVGLLLFAKYGMQDMANHIQNALKK
ncbi:hypothetical protein [Gorillibacterium sp. sgz500922]|uniref:hypothetical protein n=1 Tax=Gorillibacterium sp. sgz500922 TaxID=3446694 RepID=UPI003F6794EA